MASRLNKKPEILAPAGDESSFLAALAAGADAIYLGLKHFSARMEAENFSLTNLARLTALAHQNGARVYVAMNTIVKPDECVKAGRLCSRLASLVKNDGLIIQDLGMLDLARQAGFEGGLFLSTLANISNPGSLVEATRLGASRVILPRELSVDEIRDMGESCPTGLGLEIFVHGALCYCVSGRCYWSSYLGGKSGLRGRCVQPCRRVYQRQKSNIQKEGKMQPITDKKHREPNPGTVPGRFFSCQDLELGMLAKTMLSLPNIVSWKIEGRKKGPHYVYHVVTAYRLLRDNPDDPAVRKEAEDILSMALGRPGVRARFLPQRGTMPMSPHGQTSSGLLAGKTGIGQDGACIIKPRFDLLKNDYLRIGTEDERWHSTMSIKRNVPKGGSLALNIQKHKIPKTGVPVFLIDRREPELEKILKEWRTKADKIGTYPPHNTDFVLSMPKPVKPRLRKDMLVMSNLSKGKVGGFVPAVWLSNKSSALSPTLAPKLCWWLPPVIWPEEENFFRKTIVHLLMGGARHFVCNAPWQAGFFASSGLNDLDLIAGPFCNIANALAIMELEKLGFGAAFVSPELESKDLLALPGQSSLPLGLVLSGFWPVGLSRYGLAGINTNEVFFSPKGEPFWSRRYGQNIWIYPGWPLELQSKRKDLLNAGYSFFAVLDENPPRALPQRERNSLFNWDGRLL